MITKTNFQMTRELKDWYPKRFGVIGNEEAKKIADTFQIDERDEINLRNLRDFCVMFYSREKEDEKQTLKDMDKMSAIVCVIDHRLFNIGAEV